MARRRTKTRDHVSKEVRRSQALARKELWDMLTPDQKRESLRARRGESKRQLARLG